MRQNEQKLKLKQNMPRPVVISEIMNKARKYKSRFIEIYRSSMSPEKQFQRLPSVEEKELQKNISCNGDQLGLLQ
jgi:hypothetical protein